MKRTLKIILYIVVLFNSCKAAGSNMQARKNNDVGTTIKVLFKESGPNDSLVLYQSKGPFALSPSTGNFKSIVAKRQEEGLYVFNLQPIKQPVYICISKLKSYAERKDISHLTSATDASFDILPYYVANEGDNVSIKIDPKLVAGDIGGYHSFHFEFSGKGALKYRVRWLIDSVAYLDSKGGPILNPDFTYNSDNFENQKITNCLSVLNEYRGLLSLADCDQLQVYTVASIRQAESKSLWFKIQNNFNHFDEQKKKAFLESYDSFSKIPAYPQALKALLFSRNYVEAELGRQEVRALMKYGKADTDSLYFLLKTSYYGEMLERILTLCLLRDGPSLTSHQGYIEDALHLVKSSAYIHELYTLKRKAPGNKGYDFNLPDSTGKKVRLTDYKGKIVFIDFWYTGCGNCARFYKDELSKVEESFKDDPRVVFLSISIDKNKRYWEKSVNSGLYTSPIAMNLYTDGNGSACDVIRFYQVLGYPTPIIIDQGQKIYKQGSPIRTFGGISKAIDDLLGK